MTEATAEGRHASWLELFFDLVIVAAVAQLAHLLHEPSGKVVFFFAVFYYCIWSVWTSFSLYSNVLGAKTRRRAMLFGMFGIAVMAATVQRAAHVNPNWFVLAFVVCRVMAGATWQRTGKFLTSWPSAIGGFVLIPWFVSLGLDGAWKYGLWVFAIVLDIGVSVIAGARPEATLRRETTRAQQHNREMMRRAARGRNGGRRQRVIQNIQEAKVDMPHFGERLGLFVIIVLGEAVAQVVTVAADVEVNRQLWLAVLAGFGLLVCFWWLTLQYGAVAAPMSGVLRPSIALPMHFLLTAAIVCVAAGLGALTEHVDAPMPAGIRWVLCGGAAAYFLCSAIVGFLAQAPRRWLLGWPLPAAALCVVLGVVGGRFHAVWLVIGLLAAADWQVLYPRVTGQRWPDPEGSV